MTGLTAALASYAVIPTAHAQGPKPIYDENDESETVAPAPGTVVPSQLAAKEQNLTKSEVVNGVTVRSNENLEQYIGKGRAWLEDKAEVGQKKADNVFERYLSAERNVTSTIAAIKSDEEDLLPGAIYVLVATLSGSVLARNRNFLVRGITPLICGAAAFKYFLPDAFGNTGKLIWRFEQKAPALADAHLKTQKQVENLVTDANKAVADSKSALENGVHATRKFVADTTGLQIPSDKPKKE